MQSLKVPPDEFPDAVIDEPLADRQSEKLVVLAGGCFWCVEAVFMELHGVLSVRSGYAGDTSETADYPTVCSGRTNHAEAVEIRYDASQITYGQLLKIHFSVAHDPTQLDRQGYDIGRQYRSAIFFADEQQLRIAEAYINQLNDAHVFSSPIVTRLEPLEGFYPAEEYHQNYAARNPGQPYVFQVALPKVGKLKHYFGGKLKR